MVTSYSWKAAQLIATPANPGFSSHTMFGIARDSSRPIGSTKASADTFHSGVVMIINDEISFSMTTARLVGTQPTKVTSSQCRTHADVVRLPFARPSSRP
jgi:hypothetical protein